MPFLHWLELKKIVSSSKSHVTQATSSLRKGLEVYEGQRPGLYVRDFSKDKLKRGGSLQGGSKADNSEEDKWPIFKKQAIEPSLSSNKKMWVLTLCLMIDLLLIDDNNELT